MEIHKNLLASISPELDKHVNNNMKEGIEGIIHLPDEGEELLTLFTEWAYTGEYTNKSIRPKISPDPKDPWPTLHCHLQLCVFADKFNISVLKELAESKFHTEINGIEPNSERDATWLVFVIGYAYDNLPCSDPILKFLAQYASWKLGLLRGTTGFKELTLTQPAFFEELFMHLNGLNAKPTAPLKPLLTPPYPTYSLLQPSYPSASLYTPLPHPGPPIPLSQTLPPPDPTLHQKRRKKGKKGR